MSHTPLYPFILSTFLSFGENPTTGLYFIYFQQALGVVASVLIYCVAIRRFSPAIAFGAALLFSFSAMALYYEQTIHTEPFAIVILYTLIWATFLTSDAPNWRRYMIIGLLCAIAALTRPVSQFFVAIIIFFLTFSPNEKHKIRPALIIGLTYLLAMLPWMAYNKKIHGFFGTSMGQGNNILYRAIDVDRMKPRHDSKYPLVHEVYQRLHRPRSKIYHAVRRELEATPGITPVKADRLMWGFGWETVAQHPFLYIGNTCYNWTRFFSDPEVGITTCPTKGGRAPCCRRRKSQSEKFLAYPNQPVNGPSLAKSVLYPVLQATQYPMVPIGLLAFMGYLFIVYRDRSVRHVLPESFLLLTVLYYTAFPVLLNAPEDRYRLPVDPIIFLFALYGLVTLVRLLIAELSDLATQKPLPVEKLP